MFFGVTVVSMFSKFSQHILHFYHRAHPLHPDNWMSHSALFSSSSKNSKSLHRKHNRGDQTLFCVLYFHMEKCLSVCRVKRQQPKLWISPTTVCKHFVVYSDQAVVIFHNHWTLPHPSPQYLQPIRPLLPSLPLVRRHLYSCALCLATSTGAILDRIYRVYINLM